MGQVPAQNKPTYTLIGSGRLAKHLAYYFDQLKIPFTTWSRQYSQSKLLEAIKNSSHVLLCINDDVIESFISEHPGLENKILVHFSGALTTPSADSVHPLMTFTDDRLYSLETYQKIPFIIEPGRRSFQQLFPQLPNPSYILTPELKPLYHSLCVASGNFTNLLWQRVRQSFESDLNLPADILNPYMEQVFTNLVANPDVIHSGPLARGDVQTISKNLEALKDHELKNIYQAFVEMEIRRRHERP